MNVQDLLSRVHPDLSPAAKQAAFLNILGTLSPEDKEKLARETLGHLKDARQLNQIEYYQLANPDALAVHLATTKEVIAVGGNRSSKTDTILADAVICMTKVVPRSLKDIYPKEKLQCPMRIRLMCESLTNTWEPVIKSKLQWDKWNGRGEPGGPFGHWGWVPRSFLLKGRWDESWSEKNRTLTLTCGCTMQVMSYDQDVEDLSGASIHRVINDEPPPALMYRENKMRTMDTGGQLYTAMTPSDDPHKALRGSWIFDVYDRGLPGPGKDPDVTSVNLYTEKNRILDADSIALIVKDLTHDQRETRLHGAFLHLSGRIYPTYTDRDQHWCFKCNEVVIVRRDLEFEYCTICGSDDTCKFNHLVDPVESAFTWPVVFVLDPHPRKGHMMAWYAIDPCDDWWQIHEMTLDLQPKDVRDKVFDYEKTKKLDIRRRLMDPKMAGQAASNAGVRHLCVKDAFDQVGLRCTPAQSDFSLGRQYILDMLAPDSRTRTPRFHVFRHCIQTNKQFKNYVWDEFSSNTETKDPKAVPITKHDDFPTLLKYLALDKPSHRSLRMIGQRMQGTRTKRAGAYG